MWPLCTLKIEADNLSETLLATKAHVVPFPKITPVQFSFVGGGGSLRWGETEPTRYVGNYEPTVSAPDDG
jgi:hypothetical protein